MKASLSLVAVMALALASCSKKSGDTNGALTAPHTPIAAVAPPAGKQWTDMVSQTAEGGSGVSSTNREFASFVRGSPQN